jgi:hypothetical protein
MGCDGSTLLASSLFLRKSLIGESSRLSASGYFSANCSQLREDLRDFRGCRFLLDGYRQKIATGNYINLSKLGESFTVN